MPGRFSVKIPTSVDKSMKKIPLPWRERIGMAIESIALDPFQGAKMHGQYKDVRKIRVWPYRVLYRIDMSARIVELLEVDHRGSMSYD